MDQPNPVTPVYETGELIAAVPYLLGYHPTNALVMITVGGGSRVYTNGTLCIDLPPADSYQDLAQRYARLFRESDATGVVVLVVGTAGQDQPDPLPYHEFVAAIRTHMERGGIRLLHATWTASTTSNSHWWCYARPDECHGPVLPSEQAPAVVAAIAAGIVPFASRQALVDLLRPDDETALVRRAEQINQLVTTANKAAVGAEGAARTAVQQVDAALALDDPSQLTETDIVQLVAALHNRLVQAVCLGFATTERAATAEQLWTKLTKSVPAPYRAEPACLLTATAYLRGNRAVATQALRVAEEANPDHHVIYLLRVVLAYGLPPDLVAESLTDLAAQAREVIETSPTT